MRKKQKSLEEVTEKGDTLASLKALRRKLAKTLDETTGGRDVASLALQLQKVLTAINELHGDETPEKSENTLIVGQSKWKGGYSRNEKQSD